MNRFAEMCAVDALAAIQVGNRARHAQDAVIRARGQAEFVDGAFEQGVVARAQDAIAFDFAIAELCIRHAGARELAPARRDHAE